MKILDTATAVGVGTARLVQEGIKYAPSSHTVQVAITGAPTAVTVALNGSVDGVTFVELGEHVMTAGELSAGVALFHLTGKAVPYVQANLKVLTLGTAPTVSMDYAGGN